MTTATIEAYRLPVNNSTAHEIMSTMPPLRHSVEGQPFDINKSEVMDWIIAQPEIKQWIFDKVRCSERIAYNEATSCWFGVKRGKVGRPKKSGTAPAAPAALEIGE